MFQNADRSNFESLWRQKLESGAATTYIPGANLRVDKALHVLGEGNRILDIGCGSGLLLGQLKSRFKELHGVDISREAVAVARRNGIHAVLRNLNSANLPFRAGYFDHITILSTLQYFYDMERILRECNRVLADTGTLLLSIPNMRAIWRVLRLLVLGSFPHASTDTLGYDGGTLHYFASSNLKDLLWRNGFQTVWASGVFCRPRSFEHLPDLGALGVLKREFFSAEIFVQAAKETIIQSY